MRLRIDPPSFRDGLGRHLESRGCLIRISGRNLLEAQLLNSVSERHDRETLVAHVEAWQEAHPNARLTDNPPRRVRTPIPESAQRRQRSEPPERRPA
jgi:hypothetical protein